MKYKDPILDCARDTDFNNTMLASERHYVSPISGRRMEQYTIRVGNIYVPVFADIQDRIVYPANA